MKLLRWTCLAAFLWTISGCGQPGAGSDPAGDAVRQEKLQEIEQLKAKSAAKHRR